MPEDGLLSAHRSIDGRAQSFVRARAGAQALAEYPGELPLDLSVAYAIQDEAIECWPDTLVGWKVGRINAPWAQQLGCDRLAGPIFSRYVRYAESDDEYETPVFEGGFAAVESECVAVIGADAPASKLEWTWEEARELLGAMHIGVEIASSPFRGINDLGPLVTISDFGNNHGLLIGPEIPDWRAFEIGLWQFETRINDSVVGAADASSIPGGPIESVRALLEICARRGRPLRKGALISTGAVTGVHEAKVGDRATALMRGAGQLRCRLIPATSAL